MKSIIFKVLCGSDDSTTGNSLSRLFAMACIFVFTSYANADVLPVRIDIDITNGNIFHQIDLYKGLAVKEENFLAMQSVRTTFLKGSEKTIGFPEPSLMVLLGFGLVGLVVMRRRKPWVSNAI